MNVLFVNNYRGEGVYGIELWMIRNALELMALGHRVWLACRPGRDMFRRAVAEGLTVFPYDPRRGLDLRSIRQLRSILKQTKIDVICVKTYRDLRNARLAAWKLPVRVYCRRGSMYDVKNNLRHFTRWFFYRPYIIVPSQTLKNDFSRFWWVNPERIFVQHHGVDVERHANGERSAKSERRYQAVYVGRLCFDKAIDVLFAAWKLVLAQAPRAKLVLVGGCTDNDYEKLARELGLEQNVEFVGYREDIRPWLQASDLLVLPSRKEGAGLVILEAIATGLPVVASRLDTIAEYVADGMTGLLVPPADAAALAQALLALITDPHKAAAMGQAGRRRALESFTLTAATRRLESIFQLSPAS